MIDLNNESGVEVDEQRLVQLARFAMDELRIRVAHNLQLMAMVANESAHEHAWHKGDTVYCAIHTDDIVVVEQK